jgi:purine-binding chemotaxis protein CheW
VTGAEENERFLLCRIGSILGALALRDVREIMRPLPIEALTGLPPFVLGLAVIRGSPTPVIEAARLLGPSAAPILPNTAPVSARFVSLKLGERTAALAVDTVLVVRSMAAGMLGEMPPLLGAATTELVAAIGALDGKLLIVLEAARLVPNSIWGAIEGSGAFA